MSGLPEPGARTGNTFRVEVDGKAEELEVYSERGFSILQEMFTRSGWSQRSSYEPTWLGVPVIQLPEDIVMVQELIWKVRPDVIVEAGVAHGGALVLYASILELTGKGRAIGVDVEIRQHNRLAIEAHPMSHRITLIEGDSTAPDVVAAVEEQIGADDSVMVVLDSNHSREHVAAELEAYSRLVTPGSYLLVFDGVMSLIADAPQAGPGWETDNPLEAIRDFLPRSPEFELDATAARFGVTHCHGGFLRRRTGSG